MDKPKHVSDNIYSPHPTPIIINGVWHFPDLSHLLIEVAHARVLYTLKSFKAVGIYTHRGKTIKVAHTTTINEVKKVIYLDSFADFTC